METIIAATDFSSAATNAVNYAADMAIAINANLLLFHSYELPIGYMEVPAAANIDDLQRLAEAEINRCRQQIHERTNNKLSITAEVRMGTFFQELNAVCKRVQPYTVVMGSQGTTAAERLLFGNHAIYAMKHLEWPLVTVSPEAKFSSIKKIGLACDFEKVAGTTPIEEIKALVNDFNAELHVINTGRWDIYNPDTAFGSGMLKKMLDPIKPECHFIYDENTDEAIMNFVDKNKIDLLVVLPKRHGLTERILHKSHTKQMILHSHIPVMSLHQHLIKELQ
jgi:nucleotide-binding universal stress UspA family protein